MWESHQSVSAMTALQLAYQSCTEVDSVLNSTMTWEVSIYLIPRFKGGTRGVYSKEQTEHEI